MVNRMCMRLGLAATAGLVGGCAAAGSGLDASTAVGRFGMVASDSPQASLAGVEVLQAGGNAVDAAVATSLALSVTRPFSSGLGGGGFMMVHIAETGQTYVLDYRERAPAAAKADMFSAARAAHPDRAWPQSRYGGLAAATPGLIAGHAIMLERLGTRGFSDVAAPALRLAADGFPVDEHYLDACQGTLQNLGRYSDLPVSPLFRKQMLLEGQSAREGSVLRQPELARALELIARDGAKAVYGGPIGRSLAQTSQSAGGVMTADDLAAYRPTWREALRVPYRKGFELLLMPPPSSGGIAIAESLNVLEHWDYGRIARQDPGLGAHLLVEAIKQAFADRAALLGDTDFVDVPVTRLISKGYAKQLAERIDPGRAVPASGPAVPEDAGTTHFCVADRWGNVVACTETINTTFGSLVYDEQFGIVLNNEMDDFTAVVDEPNAFALRQSELNRPAPGKRPLSSMSPTIVLRDGEPYLAVGASGGPRIITATLQTILNVIDLGYTPGAAVRRPRLHHQWQPDEVYRNDWPADDPAIVGLVRRGHKVSADKSGAVVQALRIEQGTYTGVSDPRKGGRPAGY